MFVYRNGSDAPRRKTSNIELIRDQLLWLVGYSNYLIIRGISSSGWFARITLLLKDLHSKGERKEVANVFEPLRMISNRDNVRMSGMSLPTSRECSGAWAFNDPLRNFHIWRLGRPVFGTTRDASIRIERFIDVPKIARSVKFILCKNNRGFY